MSHPQRAVLSAVEDHEEEWQPHAEDFQQVGTVGKIAIGLLGASTVTHLLSTWSDWNTYGVVHRYLGGMPNVDDADLNRADAIAKFTAIPNVVISVAAAVVFVIWLWRARVNSEVFCQADHRRGHGWVLASWFCPGPNLWYPKQIVDDVWLASDPKTPVYTDDLRRFRKPTLTSVWWVAWVGALAFDVVVRRFLMWMEATVGSLRGIALAGSASLVLTVVSAVAATMVIRKINHMQTTRDWVPWWDSQAPRLTAVPTYEVTQVPTYADDDTDEQPAIVEPIAQSAPAPTQVQRQPEYQLAGGPQPQAPNPFAPGAPPAPPTAQGFPPAQNFPAAQNFPGDGAAAGGFPGGPAAAEPPKWSPFAPVVENWSDADGGPATEQFSPVESWQNEKPVEQTTYESPKTSWNDYLGAGSDDALSTSTPTSSHWLEETPPLTVVQPDPYAYQPQQPEPSEPAWAARYSEPYSYESDYLTSTSSPQEAGTAPEPEPAPVARAGRRAARVAVDSPSAIQPATPSHPVEPQPDYYGGQDHTVYAPSSDHSVYPPSAPSSPVAASSGYYEPSAPALGEDDDYLTPSKPLPPVPSYEPEPSYSNDSYNGSDYNGSSYGDSSYSSSSYESPADYQTSYSSEYSGTSYESTEYSYGSDYSNSSSSNYESSDSYGSGSQQGGTESYDTYSPNYAQEPYYPAEEQQPTEYQQQTPYSYEEPAPEQPATPRTHPRRRWV